MTAQDPGALPDQIASARGSEVARRESLGGVLRRYFLMRERIERANTDCFKPSDPGYAAYLAAKQCLEAGHSLHPCVWQGLEGLALLRLALPLALTAWASRQGLSVTERLPNLWAQFVDQPYGK